MSKKSEEVKNGLVEDSVVSQETPAQEVSAPSQKVELKKPDAQEVTPGHGTRAFRG
jgi:hypothetical protein